VWKDAPLSPMPLHKRKTKLNKNIIIKENTALSGPIVNVFRTISEI
jgi:hypothetical protein